MKKKLRGLKRADIQLDFDLYRVKVPMPDIANAYLSVVDLWPEGANKTILFQHGYAGVLESFEYQMNHFARQHRVVAPDLRGHGQSDAPYSRYTMPELVDDMHAIVEHLDFSERFILVAHSFGGSLAIDYAAAHPERLEKLVLISTAGEFKLPRLVRAIARWLPAQFIRPLWRYRPKWDAEFHVLKRMMVNNMLDWKGWETMKQIETPTMIITGARDRYFPRWVFDNVGKTIPNAEVVDVGTAKHKVQLERHQAVNRAIERFISDDAQRLWRGYDVTVNPFSERIWLSNYGPGVPASVPVPRRTLPTFLESSAYWFPKRTAIIFYGSRLTYQQLNDQVNQFAQVLHGMGVAPGDRVMLALPNMPQLIVAYYATLRIGGVVVLPTADANARQLIRQMRQTQPKVLVTLTGFSQMAQMARELAAVRNVVFCDLRSVVSASTYSRLISRWITNGDESEAIEIAKRVGKRMSSLIKEAAPEPPPIRGSSDDLAVILFTSGTTGDSKGVCLSHRNLVANTLQTRHWITNTQSGREVWLSVIPLVHSYGMTGAMNIPIAMAGTIVLLPSFDVQEVLEHVREHRPTFFPGVPGMYAAINQYPNVRDYGLDSIRACVSAAAPLPIEVQEAFEKLTRGTLVEGYGLTEASPVTHINPLEGRRKPGSIGVPIPDTEARIVDLATGEVLPPGEIGELLVRGPQVMQGYWGPGGELDRSSLIDDGWLDTGDVAVMDSDGYFHIVSRKKDVIVFGDYNVYPRDVEEVIHENSKVLEVAVVGVGMEDGETRVKAFVVPRPGVTLEKEELLALCRRRLAPYAVPWEIEFREELPKSFVGKVLRRMLVQPTDAQQPMDAGQTAAKAEPEEKTEPG